MADEKARSISSKADDLTDANNKIGDLRAEIAAIDKKKAPYVEAVMHRVYWVRVFNYLSQKMESDKMWLTGLVPLSGDNPVIEGGSDEIIASTGEQTIDSFLITGLWRENPAGSKVVYNYFNTLKEDAIAATEKGANPQFDLAERDISELGEVEVGTARDRFAYPWSLKLPLPENYQVKFTK